MASGTITKTITDVDLLSITATSGTGSSAGFIILGKSTYPYKALIPFGLTTNAANSVELFGENDSTWLLGLRNTTGAWVAGTTVTFKAFGIK